MARRPTAIIMQGGAMRAAFGSGFLYELGRQGVYVDMIAGASSSVPVSVYYAARQVEEIREVLMNEIANSKFLRYDNLILGRPVYDIEYLIAEVLKKKYPLSLDALKNSPTRFAIPLYNYKLKGSELRLSSESEILEKIWEYIHLAIIVHDKHILRGTHLESYVDGAIDPFVLYKMESMFIPENARIVALWNEADFGMHMVKYLGQKVFLALQGRNFPHEVTRMLRERTDLIKEGMQVYEDFCKRHTPLIIQPEASIFDGLDVISRSPRHLRALFQSGVKKAQQVLDSGFFSE